MAIQMQTSLDVADNSGARRVEMIQTVGGSTTRTRASLGDKIKVTVKEASPDGAVKKRKGRKGKKVAPQFRSKKDPSLVWSGRGALPRWMKAEMKGTNLKKESFRIKA